MKNLKQFCAGLLLSMLISCSAPMDEQVVKDYLSQSPAVTLYAPSYSEKKLEGCDEDYLGKKEGLWKNSEPTYYYKVYNYKVDRIEKFRKDDDQAVCNVYLLPDNLTKAGKILEDNRPQSPYKAQLKDGLDCEVVFKKIEGEWKLIVFKSLSFQRSYWYEEDQQPYSYTNLLQWDK